MTSSSGFILDQVANNLQHGSILAFIHIVNDFAIIILVIFLWLMALRLISKYIAAITAGITITFLFTILLNGFPRVSGLLNN